MTYTVVWQPPAEQELAALWMSAPDRNAIAQAADAADARLRRDPLSQGESRGQGKRIMFVTPLVIYFEISPPDRLVTVQGVKRWGQVP